MAIKSETKTLQLTFVDGANKNVSYSVSNPKAGLKKETVDAAAKAIVDAKIFATTDTCRSGYFPYLGVSHQILILARGVLI